MSNRLASATSPYLLQHAHNPVDWYEWGTEALERAKSDDKPILISIGYSSCHWCHVMERESFENNDIAQIMNKHFVCVKVDREERPDVDHVYMEAVQAMGQNGGWPLNVFLTPSQQPFYGGTYFPPGSWTQLLLQIHKAFSEQRAKIEESAQDLTQHLNISDLKRFAHAGNTNLKKESIDKMFTILQSRFDKTHGGIAKAPKFVMPTIWLFLLRYHKLTNNTDALAMVIETLEKMGRGGIYDAVGGGFARYSVDERWFAPHFEKMLYDNAQFLTLYAEAYQITKSEFLKNIIEETVGWLEKEMLHPEGGFYSALDADSEGVEGKYYTFTYAEWVDALGAEAEAAAAFFDITKEGNWDHGRNILTTSKHRQATKTDVISWKKKLAVAQRKRIRPGLDDKVLAGWNAMTIKGLVDCYNALGIEHHLAVAEKSMHFLEENLMCDQKLKRSFKGRPSNTEGFLEDYAFLIQAYIALYQATFEEAWLRKAEKYTTYVIANFNDPEDGFFHFASSVAERLIARKKEIFDNVIPASNSVMARNLLHLGTLLGREEWKERAVQMTTSLTKIIEDEPGYLSNWGVVLIELIATLKELAIVGQNLKGIKKELNDSYLPFAVMAGTRDSSSLPLLADKVSPAGVTTLFVCYNNACQAPVITTAEALKQLQ
jgi:uncharacterized protein